MPMQLAANARPVAQTTRRRAGDKWMRPGIDPAHLILALFRAHSVAPGEFSRHLKVIIATRCRLMHRAIYRRVLHPTLLIQPLIWPTRRAPCTAPQHARP